MISGRGLQCVCTFITQKERRGHVGNLRISRFSHSAVSRYTHTPLSCFNDDYPPPLFSLSPSSLSMCVYTHTAHNLIPPPSHPLSSHSSYKCVPYIERVGGFTESPRIIHISNRRGGLKMDVYSYTYGRVDYD
jgi:hypothetical protein